MKMIIQTPNFKARKNLTNFVQEKVKKLNLFSDRIIESRVFLKLDKSDNKDNKRCEIVLFIPGNDLFVSSQSHTFENAVQQAIMAAKHRIERWKSPRNKKVRGKFVPLETE